MKGAGDSMKLNDRCNGIPCTVQMHDLARSFSNYPNSDGVPTSTYPCTYTALSSDRHHRRLVLLSIYDKILVRSVTVVNFHPSLCNLGSQQWMSSYFHWWWLIRAGSAIDRSPSSRCLLESEDMVVENLGDITGFYSVDSLLQSPEQRFYYCIGCTSRTGSLQRFKTTIANFRDKNQLVALFQFQLPARLKKSFPGILNTSVINREDTSVDKISTCNEKNECKHQASISPYPSIKEPLKKNPRCDKHL